MMLEKAPTAIWLEACEPVEGILYLVAPLAVFSRLRIRTPAGNSPAPAAWIGLRQRQFLCARQPLAFGHLDLQDPDVRIAGCLAREIGVGLAF
jgi:hypothetical protein